MELVKIKMLRNARGSMHGHDVSHYQVGEEYDVTESLAAAFVADQAAEVVANVPAEAEKAEAAPKNKALKAPKNKAE